MKSYLVTGSAGFLGFHVVKALNARGIRPRVLLPRTLDPTSTAVAQLRAQDVEVIDGDLDDPEALERACAGVDCVLHLAFEISLGSGREIESRLHKGNVVGTRNLLDAATGAGVARVVVSSSSLAVGISPTPQPIDEQADWERNAFQLPYALSRREAEQEALLRAASAPPEIVVVNPAFTLGPEDYLGAPANGLVKRMGKPGFRISAPIGFGLLDVRDYADGVLRAAERGKPGQRYLLSGANLMPDDLTREVASVAGIEPPSWTITLRTWMLYPVLLILHLWSELTGKSAKVSMRLLELWGRYAWYDTSRARTDLGWETRPLKESLDDTLRWMREHQPDEPPKSKSMMILGLIVVILLWWIAAAPREEIGCCVAGPLRFDPGVERAIAAVDRSRDFAATLESLPSALPPYDDAIFVDDGRSALVTAHDGRIWRLDVETSAAEPVADVPLMAWGIHEVPGGPHRVYVCSAATYAGGRSAGEVPGLYRLDTQTGRVDALALKVPNVSIDPSRPVIYADDDPSAPELRADGSGSPARPIAVCDNLEVSADGRRIYFSEPFAYRDATIGDALDEAIALAPNGWLWRYDLETGTTRLIAGGLHFINGVVYDLHPGAAREQSVLVTQTSRFQVTRLFLDGPRAGSAEVVIDSLPGTPDGMDRDADGRLWLALFAGRGRLLTWAHENAWVKPLLMRLPTRLLLSQASSTGVVVLSADGSTPLYAALYDGPKLHSIASAVPAPSGIYLANVAFGTGAEDLGGAQRLPWPAQLLEDVAAPAP